MTRVLSGVVLLAFAAGAVWFAPALLFFLIAEGLLLLAVTEYAALARASGTPVPDSVAGAAAALTCAAFARGVFGSIPWVSLDVVLMAALVALSMTTLTRWTGGADALALAAAAVFPALYLGLPIGAMVAIRETHGREALALLMLTVIVSDTAQFYSGRTFGQRLLAPAISPKKTVEGAIGGFVVGPLFLAIAGHWWLPTLSLPLRVALGTAVVATGISGDLFESMLKRSAGLKDSSTLIPGHGGVLDRIDALLFAAPVYYMVLNYV
jgi:phosphatidate cytidylyltransferase